MLPASQQERYDLLRKIVVNQLADLIPTSQEHVLPEWHAACFERWQHLQNNERFCFVFNYKHYTIEKAIGLEQWLGYDDRSFDMRHFFNIQHPCTGLLFFLFQEAYCRQLCKGLHPLHFMGQGFSGLLSLRNREGSYCLCKFTMASFQFCETHRLLSSIMECTLISRQYNGEPMCLYPLPGVHNQWAPGLLQQIGHRFWQAKPFSKNERRVAQLLGQGHNTTRQEIAASLGISPSTAETYCRRLLAKACTLFGWEFESAAQAARFLDAEKILHT
jgi:DNA-binding CsgD family transcriptional regulator